MEQKKTLWIIAASGAFLLVVIGAALLLSAPSATNVPATASINTIPATTASAGSTAANPLTAPAAATTIAPCDESSVSSPQDNVLQSSELAFQQSDDAGSNASKEPVEETSFELNTTQAPSSVKPTSKAAEDAIAKASSKNSNSSNSTIYTADSSKNVASKPASGNKASSNSGAKNTAAKTAAPAKTNVQPAKYWVQAASFSNKKSADSARLALDDNKIPAEVFTYKDGKDNLFYRVRVGPYTTKSEAEYWKTRICKIDMFKDSQSYVTVSSPM